jgi:hypothetical protein
MELEKNKNKNKNSFSFFVFKMAGKWSMGAFIRSSKPIYVDYNFAIDFWKGMCIRLRHQKEAVGVSYPLDLPGTKLERWPALASRVSDVWACRHFIRLRRLLPKRIASHCFMKPLLQA